MSSIGRIWIFASLCALLLSAAARAVCAMPAFEPEGVMTGEEISTLEAPVVESPWGARTSRWYGRASVGMGYRWALEQSMLGAALDGELGAQNARFAGGLRLHMEAGRIQAGLPFQVVTFGPVLWMRLTERIRAGVGIDGGALLLNYETMPSSMWTLMLGGHVGGSIDLWRRGATGALQLDTSIGAYALRMDSGFLSMLQTWAGVDASNSGRLSMVTTLGLGYRP
jgi:hypothetical protein